jgi:hypothetical protein
MADPTASLTWRMWQRGGWESHSEVIPAHSASRVAARLLREFAGKSYTPADLDVTGEVKRFSYHSDACILLLRRIGK